MIDSASLQNDVAEARRARMDAEAAGKELEHLIEQIRLGRTLQEIELDELPAEHSRAGQ